MRIAFFSKNQGKVREVQNFLKDLKVEVIPFKTELKEEGLTFFENAYLKAKRGFEELNIPCIGEDSGLSVDYLDGMPGVFSNRFCEEGSDKKNREKLLEMMKGVPFHKRRAKFISCIVFFTSHHKFFVFKGEVEGFIDFEEKGEYGFGYDPIFLYPQLGKTFAQIPLEIKNRVSHRAKALREFKKFLIENEGSFF